MIPAQLQPGQRVRVSVSRRGFHYRNFTGVFTGWSDCGLAKVKEDGKKDARGYSANNVNPIK